MNNPVTDLNLGYGVRCIVGKNLRTKLTSMSYLPKSGTLTKINGSSSPVDCALKFTETSATTIVLFCLLSVITLGIYLLCTLYLANYIVKDSGSWYNLALRSLANPTPDPDPAPANEISQLEPADEEEGPTSSIPEKNPLKTFCDAMFAKKECGSFAVSVEGVTYRGNCAYDLLAKMRFDCAKLKYYIINNYGILYPKDSPFLTILKCGRVADFDLPKLRSYTRGEVWNAFVDKLLKLHVIRGADELYAKRNKYIHGKLRDSFQWEIQSGIITGALVSKIRGVFLREFSDAVDNPPLNKFFTVQQSTIQSKTFSYVRELIYFWQEGLFRRLLESAAESAQDWLREAVIGDATIDAGCRDLSLERNATAYEDGDKENVNNAFNQLLRRLVATARKLLAEMPFEFDGSEMTLLQYFDAMAAEWDGMTERGNGKKNGDLLAEAKACRDAGMAEFLAEIADESVQKFLADNAGH
jgi:hypothetical protein